MPTTENDMPSGSIPLAKVYSTSSNIVTPALQQIKGADKIFWMGYI